MSTINKYPIDVLNQDAFEDLQETGAIILQGIDGVARLYESFLNALLELPEKTEKFSSWRFNVRESVSKCPPRKELYDGVLSDYSFQDLEVLTMLSEQRNILFPEQLQKFFGKAHQSNLYFFHNSFNSVAEGRVPEHPDTRYGLLPRPLAIPTTSDVPYGGIQEALATLTEKGFDIPTDPLEVLLNGTYVPAELEVTEIVCVKRGTYHKVLNNTPGGRCSAAFLFHPDSPF